MQGASKRLVKLGDYIEQVNGEAREGIGAIKGGQYQYFFIFSHESKAVKKRDVWIVKNIDRDEIVAEHRFTKSKVVVPINSTCYGMRRISGVDKIDVTNDLEFIIIRKFPDLQKILTLFEGKKRNLSFVKKWEKHVTGMLANLVFMRRFDVSAPGSRLLAFYSSVPMSPVGLMWSIKVPTEDAKCLSLWLNSTLNIMQVLRNRKETRGAFMQIDKYTLNDLLALNCRTLSIEEKEFLLKVFEKVKDQTFPSITEQLRNKFSGRIEIDNVILETLGFSGAEKRRLIDYVYPALANEIENLKALMK